MVFEQSLILALIVLWAAFLFGGFIFGKTSPDHTRRMPTWTRMASSFTLVIAAWSWWWLTDHMMSLEIRGVFPESERMVTMAFLFAIGMTFCFIGDLFMAELIIKGDNHVLGGIAVFGLGHIAYIIGMINVLSYDPELMYEVQMSWLPLAIWLLFGFIGWYVIVFRAGNRTMMHYAALPYTLLLATTAGLAGVLYTADFSFSGIALGAVLFFLSDLILAAQLFRKAHFRLISDVVWLTYGPGQMLLVLGYYWVIVQIFMV